MSNNPYKTKNQASVATAVFSPCPYKKGDKVRLIDSPQIEGTVFWSKFEKDCKYRWVKGKGSIMDIPAGWIIGVNWDTEEARIGKKKFLTEYLIESV